MSMHIKTINGRKYYYRSIRKGDKVTSEYLGPVDRVRKSKTQNTEPQEDPVPEEEEKEDDYIG